MSRSRSPRRNLIRALEALDEVFGTLEQFPDARADLVQAIGEGQLTAIDQSRSTLRAALHELEQSGGSPDRRK
jgi:hypothetical protein